ncbi:hypothetical protein [Cellulomonas fimi]|uniref:Uncharacterized protein n=1 Tax=Cellulomonas fimi TaxID=1708 RepID=A0A7Y0M1J8_CELFI|nr:hypothetical protein [Cellulomonas fimi]NMR21373.1 hypothetical protein [Cellulomonas fimi]
MRRWKFLALLTSGVMAATAVAAPAGASTAFTDEAAQEMRDQMATLGIDALTSDALITKLESGVLPDSMSPGATPVSTETVTRPGGTETRQVYADGSVNEVTVQAPRVMTVKDPLAQLQGAFISECYRSSSGSYVYYSNCKVEYSGIMMYDSFRADYNVYKGTTARISNVYSHSILVFGGTYSNVQLTRPRTTQSGSLPAVGRLQYSVQPGGVLPMSFTTWTELRVKGTSATVHIG